MSQEDQPLSCPGVDTLDREPRGILYLGREGIGTSSVCSYVRTLHSGPRGPGVLCHCSLQHAVATEAHIIFPVLEFEERMLALYMYLIITMIFKWS